MDEKAFWDFVNEKYHDCIKSVKSISYDDKNHVYLSELENKCICFDDIVKLLYGGERVLSPDALFFYNGALVFVEFKNGKLFEKSGEKDRLKLKLKVVEGTILGVQKVLREADLDMPLPNVMALKRRLIVVYNSEKAQCNVQSLHHHMESKCHLARYERKYIDEVIFVEEKKFDNKFAEII